MTQNCMFKTEKESLERLSFDFNERDLANFRAILTNLRSNNLLTIDSEKIEEALQGLDTIGKLKLDGRIYAFHVDDSYAREQGDWGSGVELFLRQGDRLGYFLVPGDRHSVYTVDDAIKRLKEDPISKIYTGEIPKDSEFLGIPYECDPDDPLIRTVLEPYEIAEFKSKGIEVVRLDSLI